MDDVRIYDAALDDIYAIYNGGEGDIGIAGRLGAPVVTKNPNIEVTLSFSKLGIPVAVEGLTEIDINASLSNAEIEPGSLASLDQNYTFTFRIVSNSGNKVVFSLPAGSAHAQEEPTLAVSHEIMIMPEIDYREEIIHWWWMDEALGTEISDSSGSSVGSLSGDATWSADSISGTAVR